MICIQDCPAWFPCSFCGRPRDHREQFIWFLIAVPVATGGFQPRQAISFMAALALTATGLSIFTGSGDAYAEKPATGFRVLQEGAEGSGAPTHQRSGELQSLAKSAAGSDGEA